MSDHDDAFSFYASCNALTIVAAVVGAFCSADVSIFFYKLWKERRNERRAPTNSPNPSVDGDKRVNTSNSEAYMSLQDLYRDNESTGDDLESLLGDLRDVTSVPKEDWQYDNWYQQCIAVLLMIVSVCDFFFTMGIVVGFIVTDDPNPAYWTSTSIVVIGAVFCSMAAYMALTLPTLLLCFFIQRVSTNNPLMIGWPRWIRSLENYLAFKVNPIVVSAIWVVLSCVYIGYTMVLYYYYDRPDLFSRSLIVGEIVRVLMYLVCVFQLIRAWDGRSEHFGYVSLTIAILAVFIVPEIIYAICNALSSYSNVYLDSDARQSTHSCISRYRCTYLDHPSPSPTLIILRSGDNFGGSGIVKWLLVPANILAYSSSFIMYLGRIFLFKYPLDAAPVSEKTGLEEGVPRHEMGENVEYIRVVGGFGSG